MIRGCVLGVAVVAASLVVAPSASAAGYLCLGPSSTGINGTVDCDPVNPLVHSNGWVGYSTDEADSCNSVFNCAPPQIDCFCRNTEYTWSISLSSTDPDQNYGPLADTLYLWLECAPFDGIYAAEFSLVGSLEIVSFEPLNGFVNIGSAEELLLLAPSGCPTETVVGKISVAGDVSVDGATWGRTKARFRAE